MTITEKKKDLFTVDATKYVFAHCISGDCEMDAGIVIDFVREHAKLKPSCINFVKAKNNRILGATYQFKDDKRIIYNMFTKARYWHKAKPNTMTDEQYFTNLRNCLMSLKRQMLKNNEQFLAIPRIGCGKDKCKWTDVKNLLIEVFNDTEIEILVCIPIKK